MPQVASMRAQSEETTVRRMPQVLVPSGWVSVILALLAVLVQTAIMLVWRESLGVINVTLLYLILTVGLGFLLDTRAATVGAILSFVLLDVVFIPPYLTLSVADPDHVLALFVFLAVALGTSLATARIREQTRLAVRENERTTLLYDLNRSLVSDVTLDQLLQTIARGVVEIYGARSSRILTAEADNQLVARAVWPSTTAQRVDRQEQAVAQHAIGTRQVAGIGSEHSRVRIRQPHGTVEGASPKPALLRDALFVPIVAGNRVPGVLEVIGRPGGGRFTVDDERILASFADQVALAMERARLTEDATRVAVLEQSDELKSAMLAAVSHDLRTPLAAIKASASTLLDPGIEWPAATRDELLSGIEAETDRLTLMVGNLLDLSRIEGGALKPQRDWYDVGELVNEVARQARRHTSGHLINIEQPAEPLLAFIDYVEISQVLTNLLQNAIKYSPTPAPITIRVRTRGDELLIDVADQGIGIPPERLPHIFDAFYRAHEAGPIAGSGIGLAISKGLVEAHGGSIRVTSQAGVGTTIQVILPMSGEAS